MCEQVALGMTWVGRLRSPRVFGVSQLQCRLGCRSYRRRVQLTVATSALYPMTREVLPRKTYPLAPSWRNVLIASGLLLALIPVLPFMLNSKLTGTIADFVCLFIFVYGFTAISVWYGLRTRLVTSPMGIECYALGLLASATWDTAERVDVNAFGIVNLVFSQPYARSRLFSWYTRGLGLYRLMQISPFVPDWQTTELLQDIRRYAPHVVIPNELANRPKVLLRYQPSTLIIYYLAALSLVGILSRIVYLSFPELDWSLGIQGANLTLWSMASTGWLGGIVGGAATLPDYDSWLRAHMDGIAQCAAAQYLAPLGGFVIGLSVAALTKLSFTVFAIGAPPRALAGFLGVAALMLGILQVYAIQRWLRRS